MRKILFITSRNIINTCGELRLIKNRVQVFYNEWGIKTVFYALVNRDKLKKPRENIGSDSEVRVFSYTTENFIDFFLTLNAFKKAVYEYLKADNETWAVILSGYLPGDIAKHINRYFPNIKIIVDIHGANEELIEFPRETLNFLNINKLIYKAVEYNLQKQLKFADSIFVVSQALQEHIINKFSGCKDKKFYIIPCGARKQNIDFAKVRLLRKRWRNELGVADDTILFVYSGGISPWQSIDKAVEIFDKSRRGINKKARLLIMSNNIDRLPFIKNREEIIARSFQFDLVPDVLKAGDVALLLREDKITNRVAFPNKFIEYVLSGMCIICSKYLCDPAQYTDQYNLGIVYDGNDELLIESLNKVLKTRPDDKNKFAPRQELLEYLWFENTLKPVIDNIFSKTQSKGKNNETYFSNGGC